MLFLYVYAGRGQPYGEMGPLILSEDGIEITFATNYLGHHLMWKYLESLVLKSITGRVVLTSSSASFKTFRKHLWRNCTDKGHP